MLCNNKGRDVCNVWSFQEGVCHMARVSVKIFNLNMIAVLFQLTCERTTNPEDSVEVFMEEGIYFAQLPDLEGSGKFFCDG